MNKIYIGIDVGLKGAITVLDEDSDILVCKPTPILTKKVGKKNKNEYDVQAMIEILKRIFQLQKPFKDYSIAFLAIEKARSFPKQGVVSVFSFGYGFGLWIGIVQTLGIPYIVVAPRTWQKAICTDINTDDPKQASKMVAMRRFPNQDFTRSERSRVVDDGMTDSSLLALYAKLIA